MYACMHIRGKPKIWFLGVQINCWLTKQSTESIAIGYIQCKAITWPLSGSWDDLQVGDVDRINSNKGIPTIKGDGVSSTT